jgi:hypothetical protein
VTTPCSWVTQTIQSGAAALCLNSSCSLEASLEPTAGGANVVFNSPEGFAIPAYPCPWGDCKISPPWVEVHSLLLGWFALPDEDLNGSSGNGNGFAGSILDQMHNPNKCPGCMKPLYNAANTMTDARTYALWFGASAVGGGCVAIGLKPCVALSLIGTTLANFIFGNEEAGPPTQHIPGDEPNGGYYGPEPAPISGPPSPP